MKKLTTFVLAASLFTIIACGGSTEQQTEENSQPVVTETPQPVVADSTMKTDTTVK